MGQFCHGDLAFAYYDRIRGVSIGMVYIIIVCVMRPSPYDYLSAALGTCTAMTLRMYAGVKNLTLGRISVEVAHGKVAAAHCQDCLDVAEGRTGKIDRFERIISISGKVDEEVRDKLVEIAGKCPVHRTLEAWSAVITKVRSVE